MLTLLNVIIGAVITGIIGNKLVQRWQLRSWYSQQRQITKSAELQELQTLYNEITSAANNRLMATLYLLRSIGDKGNIEDRKKEYRKSVVNWMDQLSGFYSRLTVFASYSLTLRLEHDIHRRLIEAGARTAHLSEQNDLGKFKSEERANIEALLNRCQADLNNFSRDLLNRIVEQRNHILEGKKYFYTHGDFDKFSTLTLFKLLFHRRIDTFYVVRPA
jgi:hypothetical protein